MVISLSQPIVHTIRIHENKKIVCDSECPRFQAHNICAHTLAVARDQNVLERYLIQYRPNLDIVVNNAIPKSSGKKPGQTQRVRTKPYVRNTSGWADIETEAPETESTSSYEVMFLRSTRATSCYGCGGKIREKPSSDPPPPPYDIVLSRRERRVYRKRGSIQINISKDESSVYYHPLQSCLKEKFGNGNKDNIVLSPEVMVHLFGCHKQILFREFGIPM